MAKKYSRFDYGHRVGPKMAAEMAGGGKVGMPHINARVGIKAPPKMPKVAKVKTVKQNTPKPTAPQGISLGTQPFAKGGAVKKAIHIKPENKGKLRAKTRTPKDAKIPMKALEAKKSSPDLATRKQATFAVNARSWNHK